MMADEDDLTTCPVCFELYEVSGEHLPRILPCSHSVCGSCLRELVRNKKLECPECRSSHQETNFPQNKYIIAHLKKTLGNQSQTDVVIKQNPLLREVASLNNALWETKKKLGAAKEEIDEKSARSIARIEEKKGELIEKYDLMIAEAAATRESTRNKIDQDLADIDEKIVLLRSIGESVQQVDSALTMETINSIRAAGKKHNSDLANLTTLVYRENPLPEETLCGMLESVHFKNNDVFDTTPHVGPIHGNTICDGCEKTIRGKRFNCFTCDDYDLCESCEMKGTHNEHNMLIVRKPGKIRPLNSDGPTHFHVRCDSCGSDVSGKRFKCVSCANYDLCESCEIKGSHNQHNMLLVRKQGSVEPFAMGISGARFRLVKES